MPNATAVGAQGALSSGEAPFTYAFPSRLGWTPINGVPTQVTGVFVGDVCWIDITPPDGYMDPSLVIPGIPHAALSLSQTNGYGVEGAALPIGECIGTTRIWCKVISEVVVAPQITIPSDGFMLIPTAGETESDSSVVGNAVAVNPVSGTVNSESAVVGDVVDATPKAVSGAVISDSAVMGTVPSVSPVAGEVTSDSSVIGDIRVWAFVYDFEEGIDGTDLPWAVSADYHPSIHEYDSAIKKNGSFAAKVSGSNDGVSRTGYLYAPSTAILNVDGAKEEFWFNVNGATATFFALDNRAAGGNYVASLSNAGQELRVYTSRITAPWLVAGYNTLKRFDGSAYTLTQDGSVWYCVRFTYDFTNQIYTVHISTDGSDWTQLGVFETTFYPNIPFRSVGAQSATHGLAFGLTGQTYALWIDDYRGVNG